MKILTEYFRNHERKNFFFYIILSKMIELDSSESTILFNLSKNIFAHPSEEPELFCQQSKEQSKKIPERIQKHLLHFSQHGNQHGFLLIKKIPILFIEETPPGNTYKVGEKTALAKIQSMFLHVMGEMIAYEAEGYGRLFQDIVPIQSMATAQTSLGSRKELENHTEQAFSTLRPDILSLACLRGDEGAWTYILPVKSILENCNEKEIELLKQPLWMFGVDLSFKLNGNEFLEGDQRGPYPILTFCKDDVFLRFDQDLICGTTEESKNLVNKIIAIYREHRFQHNLKQGEIVLIDNNRAIHGRSSFSPNYDGNDRFLVRSFGVFDYEKSYYAREGRIVKSIYS
jgi:L-asparagine oxygenase